MMATQDRLLAIARFTVRGDVHTYDNGSSYTAITPHTEVAGHVITRFQPFKKVSLQDDLNITNDKLIDSSFQDKIRTNTVTLSYALNDRFSVFGGFTYDSIFAAGNIVYARGTAPLNDFLRDQEVDRVMQAGVEAKPSKYFGLQLTGNFDRSTGLGADQRGTARLRAAHLAARYGDGLCQFPQGGTLVRGLCSARTISSRSSPPTISRQISSLSAGLATFDTPLSWRIRPLSFYFCCACCLTIA